MATNSDILICPITRQIMTDPVADHDGNTYERDAIMQWLSTHNTSPITRRHMTAAELIPNRVVRELLEAARQTAQVAAYNITTPITQTAENITGIIVLDASGSMSTSCDIPGESSGMTRIDLTKYSARVIIESLRPGDRMGIITFSSKAYELAPIRQINSEHDKKILIGALDRYTDGGTTNIYDAVVKAVTTLTNAIQPGEPASVFLLTDGEPTVNPPDMRNQGVAQSTLDAITRNISLNQRIADIMPNITINTFGYGYSLLADLMVGITQLGGAKHGIFGFIPDATMLGTVLINAMSRARYPDPVALTPSDVTLCNQAAALTATLCKFDIVNHQTLHELNTFVTMLETIPDKSQFANALLLDFKENPDPNLGQVYKAIMPEHYSKWGKYYLMALMTAYQTRSCLNFKDNSLQFFKTAEVEQEQARLSDIFLTATQPVPTGNRYSSNGGYHSGPVNMSSYLNASGGCFGPNTMIKLVDNNAVKPITELKAGDRVYSINGCSKVECVIVSPYNGDIYKVADGLYLTPWHPFALRPESDYSYFPSIYPNKEKSYFPAEYPGATKVSYSGLVYNIVLEERACIGAIGAWSPDPACWAATLGCDYNYIPQFKHPYYGSEAVINDLKATGKYESGYITVKSYDVQRDPETGLVSKITYQVE